MPITKLSCAACMTLCNGGGWCIGAPKATHCMACKEEGMVNVVSRKCHCGRAVPNFGAAGQKKRTHCAQCKEQGMVNLSKNPAARQPLPQIPVPPPMMMAPQDPMMGMHPHHHVNMGQQVMFVFCASGTCGLASSCSSPHASAAAGS